MDVVSGMLIGGGLMGLFWAWSKLLDDKYYASIGQQKFGGYTKIGGKMYHIELASFEREQDDGQGNSGTGA